MSVVRDILGRSDYAIVSELIEPGTRVLDLGCGEGELLAWLQEHKGVDARGVELVQRHLRVSRGGQQERDADPMRAHRAPPGSTWNRGPDEVRSSATRTIHMAAPSR